jgi:carbamoyltransferase
MGRGTELVNQHWPWIGEGFASLYTQAAEAFGFGPGQEHRVEALARLNGGSEAEKLLPFFEYADGSLHVDPDWRTYLMTWTAQGGSRSTDHACVTASALQHALADALLKLVCDIRRSTGAARLCLGGGLFYNTFFNTVIAQSGLFEDVFVAPNPGNAGLAAGAAVAVSGRGAVSVHREMVSPFLGPEYTLEEIKADLDNCKLSYDCVPHGELLDLCVEALLAGRLIGWFQGRMEWGHRALGNRSILASPLSPYVLDNLNVFLKRRERYRAYSLSVPAGDAERYFEGPPHSEWMEFDYRVKDRDLFRHVIPPGAATLRVQTVNGLAPLFAELHRAFEAASGTSVLVNTSFNGFSEPIVCSPRDAIRVFYGTGLDLLVLGRFVIRK